MDFALGHQNLKYMKMFLNSFLNYAIFKGVIYINTVQVLSQSIENCSVSCLESVNRITIAAFVCKLHHESKITKHLRYFSGCLPQAC